MADNLVEISNITKKFADNTAINNVTAHIEKGKITGLVGPDGAGKTTLIRLITELLAPSEGNINVKAGDIGYMPQKFGLYEDLTVRQNLDLYADLRGVPGKERKKIFEQLLKFTSLAPFTKRLAGQLSGGMKQKLGLACVLINKPELLLLDEPGVGVDPISRWELWSMVQELLKEGITVLWSTAYLNEAEQCDNVILLDEGNLLFQGKPGDLTKGETSFEEAFASMLGGWPEDKSELADMMITLPKTGKPIIEARNLTKKYGDFTASKDINFSIKQGEIFGLLGPNGAGKTTIFKMMCGLVTPTSGEAVVKSRDKIGYMAQKFSLYDNLSVMQNLKFFSGIYGLKGKEQKDKINKIIEIFNLKDYLNMHSSLLPLGYKQRLALSCAVMHEPEVLFLDEPTSGIDPITRREFWTHINRMVEKGVTIMVTTHFMDEAELCDRISLIYRSQSIAIGTPGELKNMTKTQTMEDAFIELVKRHE